MTLNETADFISQGLESWQRDANLKFLREIHEVIKPGGAWVYPDAELIFRKTDEGFDLVIDKDPVLVEH